uniref:Uncharacterized protein n=1 Tax=Lactuca sativa TaxID=4236 RepID=A0A9R1UDV0_LACSA|nr:hypothetical protein LSAT_V11C900473340 [Lactuca sativa]
MQADRNNVLLAVPTFLYAINNYLKLTMQLYFNPATVKMLSNLKTQTHQIKSKKGKRGYLVEGNPEIRGINRTHGKGKAQTRNKKGDIVVSSSKDTTSSSTWPWKKMVENLKLAHQKLPVIVDLINTVSNLEFILETEMLIIIFELFKYKLVHRSEQVGIGDPNYGGKYYKTMEKPDYLKFEVAQLGESKTFDEGFHGAYCNCTGIGYNVDILNQN